MQPLKYSPPPSVSVCRVFHVGVSPACGATPQMGGGGKFDSKNFALARKCVLAYFDRVSGVYEVFLTFAQSFGHLYKISGGNCWLLELDRGRGRQKSAFVVPPPPQEVN